ncbi:hypothetical protein FOCC_FOCC001514 [Frankliniella occidentalis]|nr:hypothetical protein FOCC_FOCC001514 [Frankliniella occidentalis]
MLRTASSIVLRLRPAPAAGGPAAAPMSMLAPSPLRLQQLQDIKTLDDFFPKVVAQLQEESVVCGIPSETEWLAKLLHHTVPGGKMVRALATYNGMRELGAGHLTDAHLVKAMSLAWSVEMIQSAMALADDIADQAPERRGKPSWYTVAGPGAVFDVLLVEHCTYRLLKRHFSGDRYSRMIMLYVRTMFQLCFGQNNDIHCMAEGRAKFDEFSLERYQALCEFKSGEYTFYLPTATAMFADDYLDSYGVVERMGKPRTDIKNGKCTWLIAEAKRRATPAQLKALKENYGFDDEEKIANIAQLYEDLDMKQVFLDYEHKSFRDIAQKIDKYSHVLPRVLYTYVLESIKYHINR